MIITSVVYLIWVISFICFCNFYLDWQYQKWTKLILLIVQIPYVLVMWRLWKKWVAAAKTEYLGKDKAG
jgi:hypothetical protein